MVGTANTVHNICYLPGCGGYSRADLWDLCCDSRSDIREKESEHYTTGQGSKSCKLISEFYNYLYYQVRRGSSDALPFLLFIAQSDEKYESTNLNEIGIKTALKIKVMLDISPRCPYHRKGYLKRESEFFTSSTMVELSGQNKELLV